MAGKQQWRTLQEPVDYQQQRDHFPLLPRGNQHEQAGNQPPQASYQPQQGSYAPQQARYLPQQGGYPHQEASYPFQQGYPPQQAGYPPWQATYQPQEAGHAPHQSQLSPQQQAVIHQQPSGMETTDSVIFGESSVRMVCPHCQMTVVTDTHTVPGFKAWLCLPLLCALFGCLVCCCLDEFMDVVHTCPFCKNKIATYEQPL